MKKQIIQFALLISVVAGVISGCKKSDIDSKYYNPDASVTASIPTLYAGLFNNSYVIPRYWNLYTLQIPVFGEYSQTSGYTNVNKVYEQPTNYTAGKWTNYYTSVMAPYREIEKLYNNLSSDDEKKGFQAFLETARIFFYDQTTQLVDLWGDIPYSEAGSLNSKGVISLAKYDSAQTIYYSILNDLDRINTYLDTVNLNSYYTQQLAAYDYVNGGSLTKWRQYANSLRLRLAMRISYYDEANAKTIALAMLSNPTKYPLVLSASDAIQINLKGNLVSTSNDMREGFGVNPYAPGYMVDSVMVPSADPRLPLYFSKNIAGKYHGVQNTTSATQVQVDQQAQLYSLWDTATFQQNNLFPGVIITAGETNFLAAEAYQRWGSATDAANAYYNGISQSIQYYYGLNSGSSWSGTKETMPTTQDIANYKANALIAYGTDMEGNLAKIATQKWIDFNVMQANQAWTEYRRTKYPAIHFPTDAASIQAPNPPKRLLYPSEETSLNTTNYNAVKAKDNITTRIFWDVK